MSQSLKAPFPYEGGKTRWRERVWQAFGNTPDTAPSIYLEPFAGSLAVLLGNPNGPARREVVCDMSPGIANFWRSIQRDPGAVAKWADYPTIHHDLTARNYWLAKWDVENTARVREDADFYDAQAAGWWAWCKSNMIAGMPGDQSSRIPSGKGVQMQRDGLPSVSSQLGGKGVAAVRVDDVVPSHKPNSVGGKGVSMQRPDDRIPSLKPDSVCGKGVQMQRDGMPFVSNWGAGQGANMQLRDGIPAVCYNGFENAALQNPERRSAPLDGTRLQPWMLALSERLKGVIVLCRSWQSGLTSPMTMESYMAHHACAVFLDPPYLTSDRTAIYGSDHAGESDDAATGAYEWAVERGEQERYRIAYACHDGDFPVPPGWTCETMSFGSGMRREERRLSKLDCIMFSPHCFPQWLPQTDMFGA